MSSRGELVQLDVELVTGRSGFVVWTETYPCDLESAADVEQEIVRQVVRKVAGSFKPIRAAIVSPATRPSRSAYERYLRAEAALDDPDDPRGPDRALELLAKALEQDPDFALAWASRSRALWKIWSRDRTQESVRMAEEAADRAIRLNPELLEARVARAQIYRATSRYAASIRELLEVLSRNPNWDEAELQLAASYREAGDLAHAEARLRHAVKLRPGYWRNWNALGGLLVLRADYDGARAAYEKITQLVPQRNLGYEQLAAIAILQGRYDAAIAAYEKLPAPVQDGVLATNIGTAYFFQHRLPEADRYYALALRLEPGNPGAWKMMGDLETRMGRADSARAHYTEAVRLLESVLHVDPKNVAVQVERALCLAKAGECGAAGAELEAIAASIPADNAEIAHRIAKLDAVCGRRAAALEALRRAVKLGVSPEVVRDEDEFRALAGDPVFREITERK